MKLLLKTFLAVVAGVGVLSAAFGAAAKLDPAKPAPAKPTPVHSVFVLPDNAREGRDPFYPESTRPFVAKKAEGRGPIVVSALNFKGVSGTPRNYVAIINNHAFKVNDESEVLTPGGKVHVRCLEIRAEVVVVEINGQRHELNLDTK